MQTRILDLLQVLVLAILAACHLADGEGGRPHVSEIGDYRL